MGPICTKRGVPPRWGLVGLDFKRGWGSVSPHTLSAQTTQMSVKCPSCLRRASADDGKKTTENHGAGYKIRTRDPLITNQVLYQLS